LGRAIHLGYMPQEGGSQTRPYDSHELAVADLPHDSHRLEGR
jgi:hypothetical protein